MKLFVAVTDNDWYWQLRNRPLPDEVNFWQPGGGRSFQVLQPGELLLFKPHTPHHSIVGGGFFLHSSELPCYLAWEIFDLKNGASSLEEMRRRIERFRHLPPKTHYEYMVASVVLQRPFFFDETDWIKLPADFSKNVGQGKTYETSTAEGRALWEAVRLRLHASEPDAGAAWQAEMFGEPSLIRPRLGAGSFQLLIFDNYGRRCAMSGEANLPALAVTHIRPVDQGGLHRVDNGILLRADLRRLYDKGYLTIDRDLTILVSPSLEEELQDSAVYSVLAGAEIAVPERPEHRPRREFLEWHRRVIFRS